MGGSFCVQYIMIAVYPKEEIKMIKKRGFVLLIIKGFFGY